MEEKLIDYFSRIMPLTPQEADAIRQSIVTHTYLKGEHLLKEGEIPTACYFVLKGCVREYYIVDGEERTSNFFTDDDWIIPPGGLMVQVQSDRFFQCLEDTVLVIGNAAREQDMYEKNRKFETMARMILEQIVRDQQKLQATYITDSPSQRYERLMATNPGLMQRAPLYQIASYIGVKPESLSRIRKRIPDKSRNNNA